MNHDPKQLAAALQAAAPPDVELTTRPMFGGIMAYAGGTVFASLSNVGLALKLTGDAADALLEAGGEPLRYEPDSPPSKTYLVVPAAMLAGPDTLRPWIARSIAGLKRKR